MIAYLDYLYTILLFISMYVQVYFLVIFLENEEELLGKKITNNIKSVKDADINININNTNTIEILKKNKSNINLYQNTKLPSVTFLIPCWNEQDTVVATVESVLSINYPSESFKIIVIDDGSTDKTLERVQVFKNHEQIKILTKTNGGKHDALNLALKYVDTDFICSFDADTKIDKDAIINALKYFEKDKKLMALGGTVLIDNPNTIVQKAQEIEYEIFSFTKKMLGLADAVFVVPGAFSVFKKEVFEIVGGYKKAYNLEDIELTMRMQKHGFKITHAHDAIVRTKGPDTIVKLYKQRLRWSYGFIMNMFDYRFMLFNKEHKDFGIFTLPMTVFSYIILMFIFFYSLYKVLLYVFDTIYKLYLVGFTGGFELNFDYFYFNTKIYVIMSFFLTMSILIMYVLGRKIANIKKHNIWNLPYFILMFSFIAPFWVLRSLYNALTNKTVSWR